MTTQNLVPTIFDAVSFQTLCLSSADGWGKVKGSSTGTIEVELDEALPQTSGLLVEFSPECAVLADVVSCMRHKDVYRARIQFQGADTGDATCELILNVLSGGFSSGQ